MAACADGLVSGAALQVLMDDERANPAWHARVKLCLSVLAQWMGRARVHSPVPLTAQIVTSAQQKVNMQKQDEVGMLTFMTCNLPVGWRCMCWYLLDHDELVWHLGAGAGRVCGVELKRLLDKTNREAREKPSGLQCIECCDGESPVGADGKLRAGKPVCPVHLLRYYEELKARDAGVTVAELRGPLLATAKKPENVPKVRAPLRGRGQGPGGRGQRTGGCAGGRRSPLGGAGGRDACTGERGARAGAHLCARRRGRAECGSWRRGAACTSGCRLVST